MTFILQLVGLASRSRRSFQGCTDRSC